MQSPSGGNLAVGHDGHLVKKLQVSPSSDHPPQTHTSVAATASLKSDIDNKGGPAVDAVEVVVGVRLVIQRPGCCAGVYGLHQ